MENLSPEKLQQLTQSNKWGRWWWGVYMDWIISNTADPQKRKQLQDLSAKIDTKRWQHLIKQEQQLNNVAVKLNDSKSELSKKVEDYYNKTNQSITDKLSDVKDNINSKISDVNNNMTDVANTLSDRIEKSNIQVNDSLGSLWTKLWLQTDEIKKIKSYYDVLQQKVKLNNNLLNTQNKIWDTTMTWLRNNLKDLSTQYWSAYKKIWDRIDAYEADMKKTYTDMQENLKKIWDNNEKVLKFNQAAAGSAAEKSLRWMWGRWAKLRVANYLQQVAQKWSVDLAKLQNTLLQQQNWLSKELLALKNQVVSNKNINEKEKVNILDRITTKYNNLLTDNEKFKLKVADIKAKPYQDAITHEEKNVDTVEAAKLQQKLEKINQKWLNTPTGRQQMLGNTLANAWVVIPKSVENLALNTPSYLESIRIVQNYIIKSKNAWNNKLAAILAVAKQDTTITKSKSVYDAQQTQQPPLNK